MVDADVNARLEMVDQFGKPLTRHQYAIGGDHVEMRNGRLLVIREQIMAELPLSTGLAALQENFIISAQPSIGLLPRGTAFLNVMPTRMTYLIVREPDLYSIKTTFMRRPLRIALPWQYFFLDFLRNKPNTHGVPWAFNAGYLFWSRNRISTLHDRRIIGGLIPNVTPENGSICFGVTMPASDLPIHERADNIVDSFYSPESEFNGDLKWGMPKRYVSFYRKAIEERGHEIRTKEQQNEFIALGFAKWAEESRLDRTVYMQWEDWANPTYGYLALTNYMAPEFVITNDEAAAETTAAREGQMHAGVVGAIRQKAGTRW